MRLVVIGFVVVSLLAGCSSMNVRRTYLMPEVEAKVELAEEKRPVLYLHSEDIPNLSSWARFAEKTELFHKVETGKMPEATESGRAAVEVSYVWTHRTSGKTGKVLTLGLGTSEEKHYLRSKVRAVSASGEQAEFKYDESVLVSKGAFVKKSEKDLKATSSDLNQDIYKQLILDMAQRGLL